MSRPLRLEFPGAVWHVTARGNERRDVFRDDADRELFLSILGRTVELFRWKLHAWVLMRNHYHLLVETPEPTLSRGMRQLGGLYTQAFNRRHRREGHLFQGRFKSILVGKESYLLELARYLVLNPVRGGAATSARAWRWSSYRATAGLALAPPWLETKWTLRQFGASPRKAQERYRAFVAEGRTAAFEPWSRVRQQIYLGTDEFVEEALATAEGRSPGKGIPRRQRQRAVSDPVRAAGKLAAALGTSLEELNARTRTFIRERRLLAWALRQHSLLTLERIGGALGVGVGQASVLARAGEVEARKIPTQTRRLEAILTSGGL
ncbi:MAG: REP-associated tyrosine transposase [Acidithiobacillales bacterium]